MQSDVSKKFEDFSGSMTESNLSSKVVQDIIVKYKSRVNDFKDNCTKVWCERSFFVFVFVCSNKMNIPLSWLPSISITFYFDYSSSPSWTALYFEPPSISFIIYLEHPFISTTIYPDDIYV